MAKALKDLDNLIDEMSIVANEASEIVDLETFYTPNSTPERVLESSGDGSSESHVTKLPMKSTTTESNLIPQAKEKPLPPLRGSSQKAMLLPQSPRRQSKLFREREPTILTNSPEVYPKGGEADLYYRDWAYANRKPSVQKPGTELGLESANFASPKLKLNATDRNVNWQSDRRLSNRAVSEPDQSPLHRAVTAPLPWVRTDNTEHKSGLKRAHTEKWPKYQDINRYSLSASPPVLAFTKNGHISQLRHQPVARKWNASRKRLTATIACVNTFAVGFQVGIYVRVANPPTETRILTS
jgi:hypothetical protein